MSSSRLSGVPTLEAQITRRATLVLGLGMAAVGIGADQLCPGWGRVAAMTGVVFVAAFVMWPQFRRYWWFWTTLLPLLCLQIATFGLFGKARSVIESIHPAAWFLLTFVNFICVATAIVLVAQFATRRTMTK